MENYIVDTCLLFAPSLEESDFETHKDEIIGRANIIEAAGKLAIPIVCWNAGFDKEEGNFAYEVGEERTKLLNFGAILHLYSIDKRQWEKVDCWVCDTPEQADAVLHQYDYNFND